eukprot:CAMPEP_0169150320 /NCGR_PEP_ID=MMETSP1015-20121227/50106_1 /TAXON_ID=342587 /ORGANISM="Karlodinium micrum, Strain CCMP2283" /LENGTH=651 /DNA_ID=CAMNT_0009219417 /DNA_START=36 /DNA_END=1994 /DNA_ORIENTATION=-
MVEEAVVEVQRRLAEHKACKPLVIGADKLKKDYDLSQQAELAIRLLGKDAFAELLSGGQALKTKLKEVPDASEMIVQLATGLDPDVQGLLDAIASADGGGEAEEQETWPEEQEAWPEENASSNSSVQAQELTVTFQPDQPLGLSREIGKVVAVKEGGQAEALGVLPGMRLAKVNGRPCSNFDAAPFQKAKSSGWAFEVTFVPEATDSSAAQEDEPPGLAPAQAVKAVVKKAKAKGKAAASSMPVEEAVAETQRRLAENKKMPHYFGIVRWQKTFQLSEAAVLSLRMLSADNLAEIFSSKAEFEAKFKDASVEKRNEIVVTVTEALDPEAAAILKTLKAAEAGEDQAEEDEEEAEEEPAVASGNKPAWQTPKAAAKPAWQTPKAVVPKLQTLKAAAVPKSTPPVMTAVPKSTPPVMTPPVMTPPVMTPPVMTPPVNEPKRIVPGKPKESVTKDADPAAMQFVTILQNKLKQNKALQGPQLTKEIETLRDKYRLTEEIEVTLRLLKPDDLRGLVETEKMLDGSPKEKKEAVEVMVSSADDEATALAKKLKAIQEQEESRNTNGKQGEHAAPNSANKWQQQGWQQQGWSNDWKKRSASVSGSAGGESVEKKAKAAASPNDQLLAQFAQMPKNEQMAAMAKMMAAMASGGGMPKF